MLTCTFLIQIHAQNIFILICTNNLAQFNCAINSLHGPTLNLFYVL